MNMKLLSDPDSRLLRLLRSRWLLASAFSAPVIAAVAATVSHVDLATDTVIDLPTHATVASPSHQDRPRPFEPVSAFERKPIATPLGLSMPVAGHVRFDLKVDLRVPLDDLRSLRLEKRGAGEDQLVSIARESVIDPMLEPGNALEATTIFSEVRAVGASAWHPTDSGTVHAEAWSADSHDQTASPELTGRSIVPEPSAGGLIVFGLVLLASASRFDR